MNFDVDSGKLLYALGILFAGVALVYFGRDVVFGLSITVKALLLLLAFVALFLTGVAIERDALDAVAFVLSALAYVAFLGYVLVRYDPSETTTFLLFVASAILFVGLGYRLRQGTLPVSVRTAGYAVLGLVVVGAALVGADVLGGGVTYTTDLDETVTVTAPDDARTDRELVPAEGDLGTVTARNDFVFSRPLDLPSLRGCLVGPDGPPDDRVSVRYDRRTFERGDVIPGSTELTYAVRVRVPVASNGSQSRTFPVERRPDCDVSRSEPTLVVVVDSRSH